VGVLPPRLELETAGENKFGDDACTGITKEGIGVWEPIEPIIELELEAGSNAGRGVRKLFSCCRKYPCWFSDKKTRSISRCINFL